jgi:predicted dehydrogenase
MSSPSAHPGSTPLRVAILGARGIGRVHARHFHALGADVCAILGSTPESAAEAARELESDAGVHATPFSNLDALLDSAVDAVCICTPPELHHAQIRAVAARGLPILCEKPLFWRADVSRDAVERDLADLTARRDLRLRVNTSNVTFVDAIRDRVPDGSTVQRFDFWFHTAGACRGRDIAVDLMPHAFSLLRRLVGMQPIAHFHANENARWFACRFMYGSTLVTFDLREGRPGPSALSFAINGREFRRVQHGAGATYRVHLHDVSTGDDIAVEDPFRSCIAGFLRDCAGPATAWPQDAKSDADTLQLMAQVLLPVAA